MSASYIKKLFVAQAVMCGLLFFLIILGAGVRKADAGLSCPDWPLCLGQLIPPFNTQVFLEWFHRKIAMWVGVYALVMAYFILRRPDFRPRYSSWVLMSFGLFLIQAFLGKETVAQLLKAEIVTAHLLGGYLVHFINLGIFIKLKKAGNSSLVLENLGLKLGFTVLLILSFAQSFLGGLVSSHYAGMACMGFPTCNGAWWPEFHDQVALHFVHRLGAYALVMAVASLGIYVFKNKKADSFIKKISLTAMLLILIQLGLGIAMIFNHIDPALSVAHSAGSLGIFTCMALGVFHVSLR